MSSTEPQRVVVDLRTDIFSLGVTLYHCLTNQYPFDAESYQGVLRAIMLGEYAPLRTLNPRVPRDLANIVAKCMEHDSKRRFENAREMADELRRFRSNQAVRTKGVHPLRYVGRWVRKRAVLLLALLALGAGAMLVGQIQSAKTADWVTVSFAESENKKLDLLVRQHPREWQEPLGSERRVKTGKTVRLPPGRIYEVVTEVEGVRRSTAHFVDVDCEAHQFKFRWVGESPESRGFVRLPGEPELYVRLEPVSYGEARLAVERYASDPCPPGSYWVHIDWKGGAFEAKDSLANCSVHAAMGIAADLGCRLPTETEFKRIMAACQRTDLGWREESRLELLETLKGHHCFILQFATQNNDRGGIYSPSQEPPTNYVRVDTQAFARGLLDDGQLTGSRQVAWMSLPAHVILVYEAPEER